MEIMPENELVTLIEEVKDSYRKFHSDEEASSCKCYFCFVRWLMDNNSGLLLGLAAAFMYGNFSVKAIDESPWSSDECTG